MPNPEQFLRLNGETLLYVVFFGSLIVFGIVETRATMRNTPAKRTRRWPVNAALTFLNIMMLSALPVTSLVMADVARDRGIGLLNMVQAPVWLGIVAGILVFSLQSWAVHFAMHHVPVFWRFHRVHHTDTHLDITTTVRFHPVEMLLNLPVAALVIFSTGAPPVAVMIYELLDAGINVFSHANIRLPGALDRVLSRLVVTPHLHRIHHSPVMRETNSNFGATLPLWDMVFGTYRRKTPDDLARQRIGLDEMQDARAYSLWWAITLPLRDIRQKPEDKASDPEPVRDSL